MGWERRERERIKERTTGERGDRQEKKKESAKKDSDYYPPSPIYVPSYKEDALPLFESLTSRCREKEEGEKEQDPIIDYYPPSSIFVPSYKEDTPALDGNLVPAQDPALKRRRTDKQRTT